MAQGLEASISVRLLWPFARVVAATAPVLEQVGAVSAQFADPGARLPRAIMTSLLDAEARRLPTLGLQAAELMEPQDLDVVEYAARAAPTLEDATRCLMRYFQLIDDGVDMWLTTEGERATWWFRLTPGVSQPPAANDFAVACALSFARRNSVQYEPPLEVRLMHDEPEYAAEYARAFAAPVRFGAPENAIVCRRSSLSISMRQANAVMAHVYEQHAARLVEELARGKGIIGRTRRVLREQFRLGPVTMERVARDLAMAVATLRRRLEEEGTTFVLLRDEVRHELAIESLRDPSETLSTIAFSLGYGNVTSFTRAFQRWTGVSPAEYRLHREDQGPVSGAGGERIPESRLSSA